MDLAEIEFIWINPSCSCLIIFKIHISRCPTHQGLVLWSILYKFIVLDSLGQYPLHFGSELQNVSLQNYIFFHFKILIYDFSITKEFICNINCSIFSAIHSVLRKLSTWLMADNKKIKALKNSRKKESKINNAPCTFQNRSNKKDDEMVLRYTNVIPIYAYINWIGNDMTPGWLSAPCLFEGYFFVFFINFKKWGGVFCHRLFAWNTNRWQDF